MPWPATGGRPLSVDMLLCGVVVDARRARFARGMGIVRATAMLIEYVQRPDEVNEGDLRRPAVWVCFPRASRRARTRSIKGNRHLQTVYANRPVTSRARGMLIALSDSKTCEATRTAPRRRERRAEGPT